MTAALDRLGAPARTRDRSSRRASQRLAVAAFAVDAIMVVATVLMAMLGRELLPFFEPSDVGLTLTTAAPSIVAAWLFSLAALGSYRTAVFGAGTDEYKRVISATLATFAGLGIACYLIRFDLSRGFFLLALLTGVPMLVLGRLILRRALQRARSEGTLQFRVLIAGTESHVEEIAAVLRRETWLGYHVIGAVTPAHDERSATRSGIPLVGTSRGLATAALEVGADVVFLAGGAFDSAADLRRLGWELESEHVQVVIAPSVTDVSAERVRIRPVGGMPLIHLEKPRSSEATRVAKRAFDLLGAAALVVLALPVLAVAALAIRRHDGGPVVFRQARVGRDGESFACLKLRTMVVDAESRLPELRQATEQATGLFKMVDDPRITPPGRWLRRLSIDELPQLFNVLRGEMSLVGPRPPLEREVASYDDDMTQRLRVRPGMTGLWQVSGRSELSWEETVRLDLYYVDNWSMVQDLAILARTFRAVLARRGAY